MCVFFRFEWGPGLGTSIDVGEWGCVVVVRDCLVFVSVRLGDIMLVEECMMSELDLLGCLDPAVVTILVCFTNIMASHRFCVHLLTGSSIGFWFRWSISRC